MMICSMKIYEGKRTPQGCVVTVLEDGGNPRRLDPRFDLREYNPSGFDWNCTGSGGAQLAIGLAADVLADDRHALRVHQKLMTSLVGRLAHEGWTLNEETLRSAITAAEMDRGHAL
jgi:hypothetical protein